MAQQHRPETGGGATLGQQGQPSQALAGSPRGLLALLRRVVTPRAPAIVVMERDGRMVCHRRP